MIKCTDQQLRDTYKRESAHRPHWPDTFEAAMADPVISRIVAMLCAHQVPAFGRRKAERAKIGLDQKRLASGEKPEDFE